MNKRSGFRTGGGAVSAGYGITIVNGVVAVSLSEVANNLANNTKMATTGTVLSTVTLQPGTWFVVGVISALSSLTTLAASTVVAAIELGTATATFANTNGTNTILNSGTWTQVVCTSIVTVTVAGTITLTGFAGVNNSTDSITAQATARTGMTAIRLA